MKDNIPCGKIRGQKAFWNPEKKKCTVEKSPLCELREPELAVTLGELPSTKWPNNSLLSE